MASDGSGRGSLRVGQAAEMLQVSVETLRRWDSEGRLRMTRSSGGQRLVPIEDEAVSISFNLKAQEDCHGDQ